MSDSDKARDRKQRLHEHIQRVVAEGTSPVRRAAGPTGRSSAGRHQPNKPTRGLSAAPGAASRSTTTASAADHCVTTLRASYSLQPSSASLALIPSRLGLISAFAHSSATVSTASARG